MTCVGLADELMPNASLTSIGKTASINLLFCFRRFSLDKNEQEKAKQKEQETLTPSRGSFYLKIFTIVQKRVEGDRSPATTSHSRSRKKSQDPGTIQVRM